MIPHHSESNNIVDGHLKTSNVVDDRIFELKKRQDLSFKCFQGFDLNSCILLTFVWALII